MHRNTFDAALVRALRDTGPLTRAQIAQRTGWARSTITQRIEELVDANLALALRDSHSTGGRPPERIAFNSAAGVVLAACFGAARCELAVTDLAGSVLASATERFDLSAGPGASLAWLAARFDVLLDGRGGPVWGAAVGLPGPVDFAAGRPISSPALPGWDGFDVAGWLSERYGCPAFVENDANLMALGAAGGFQHVLFVKADEGIGAGLVVAGELYRGAHGFAGDLGHVFVPGRDDAPCDCGNTGCLEAVAGGRALARRLTAMGLPAAGADEVAELARGGDLRAIRAVRDAGRDLGSALAGLLNAFNPEVVIVGGALTSPGNHLLSGVREVVYRRSPPMATSSLRIVAADPGHSSVRGAATLTVNALLEAPPREMRVPMAA